MHDIASILTEAAARINFISGLYLDAKLLHAIFLPHVRLAMHRDNDSCAGV